MAGIKFVNAKSVQERTLDLYKLQAKRRKLRAQLRLMNEEIDSLESFLIAKQGRDYRISDDEGYLMQGTHVYGEREDIDDVRVRAFYAKMGKTVPMKKSEWHHLRIAYVREESED